MADDEEPSQLTPNLEEAKLSAISGVLGVTRRQETEDDDYDMPSPPEEQPIAKTLSVPQESVSTQPSEPVRSSPVATADATQEDQVPSALSKGEGMEVAIEVSSVSVLVIIL